MSVRLLKTPPKGLGGAARCDVEISELSVAAGRLSDQFARIRTLEVPYEKSGVHGSFDRTQYFE